MKFKSVTYCLFILLFVQPRLLAQSSYAIKNVNVIPMNREVVLANQTVIVQNGKIKLLGNTSTIKIPENATIIDGTGKYLMPGLFDMHAHFFYEQGVSRDYLPTETAIMLANGVTTARIMNGCDIYMDVKNKIASGKITGPELFVVSPQLVGAWPWKDDTISPKAIVTTAAEAEAFVRQYKKEGYSEIKITFFVKKTAYDAIIAAAKKENIKVTGHVGPNVKLPAALVAGQQVEHLDEFIDMLLPDSLIGKRVSVSGPNIWNKKAWETVDWLDENKIASLVQQVKQSGIYITPTQYFFQTNFGKGQTDEEIRSSPDYSFIPVSLLEKRNEVRHYYWDSLKVTETKRLKWLNLRKRMIKELNDAGVKIMCGSDSPEWFLVQGFSVHKELEALTEAGLTNYQALQTATINPANYLGIINRTGTIEQGKEADLILLDKNPVENISNTKSISGLFKKGQWFDAARLKNILLSKPDFK